MNNIVTLLISIEYYLAKTKRHDVNMSAITTLCYTDDNLKKKLKHFFLNT